MGTEHRVAAHGGAFEPGREFLDVSSCLDDGGGEFLHNAGPVISHDIHGEGPEGWRSFHFFTDGLNRESLNARITQGREEGIHCVRGHFDPGDARELSGEAGHAAFQPVSTMLSNDIGKGVHNSGAVASKHRHDEIGFHAVSKAGEDPIASGNSLVLALWGIKCLPPPL